jgi:hypothetical protein
MQVAAFDAQRVSPMGAICTGRPDGPPFIIGDRPWQISLIEPNEQRGRGEAAHTVRLYGAGNLSGKAATFSRIGTALQNDPLSLAESGRIDGCNSLVTF